MKTLLVSENKEDWNLITRICKNLYGKKLDVVCVGDHESAIDKASSDGPFGFFIIDVNIKAFDPIGVTRTLIDLTGDRPLLFLGTSVVIKDLVPYELFNSNEYNEILSRPIDPNELKEKFEGILKWAQKEEFEASIEEISPEEFIPMKLKSFYLYTSFPYDIYMEVATGKYIRILTADKPYSITTLSIYAKKNVKYLHIRKDDQIKYLESESRNCVNALDVMPPSHKDFFLLLLKSITISHQYLLALGVNDTVKELIEKITIGISDAIDDRKTFIGIAKSYPLIYEGVASKSLMTALIAGLITEKLKYSSQTTKSKLFVAAILMDFLLRDEALAKVNLLDDPTLSDYSEAQLADFIQHPLKAADIAAQFNAYTDIDSLVANHQELPNRNGFPNKPSHTSLTTLNAILNSSQYIAAEIDGVKIEPAILRRILKHMIKEYNIGSFKEVLSAAKKVITLDL